MKLITMTLIILATLVIPAKEKESECIKELNKCRNTCYAEGIKPDGECNNKMIITDIIVKGKK